MNGLLHLNLRYGENNVLLWAKTEIRGISFSSQVNYFWWRASSAFCYRHAALHTEHYTRTHKERSTGGVYPDALLCAHLPLQSYLWKVMTRHRFRNGGKEKKEGKTNTNPTTTKNVGTEKRVDKEKGSFPQYVSAASKAESNGDVLLLLALRMGSS